MRNEIKYEEMEAGHDIVLTNQEGEELEVTFTELVEDIDGIEYVRVGRGLSTYLYERGFNDEAKVWKDGIHPNGHHKKVRSGLTIVDVSVPVEPGTRQTTL